MMHLLLMTEDVVWKDKVHLIHSNFSVVVNNEICFELFYVGVSFNKSRTLSEFGRRMLYLFQVIM